MIDGTETEICGSLQSQLSAELLETWLPLAHRALKQLADSNLEDFEALRLAANELPQPLREQWRSVVEAAQSPPPCGSAKLLDASSCFRFIQIVRVLNESWFLKLGYLFCRHTPRNLDQAAAPTIWDQADFRPARIDQRLTFAFADRRLNAYLVLPLSHRGSTSMEILCSGGSYDRIQGYTVIHRLRLNIERVQMWHLCGQPSVEPFEKEVLAQSRFEPRAREEHRYYAQTIFPQFPARRALDNAILVRTLIEELRHAADHLRAQARFPPEFRSTDYYRLFGDSMLSRGGRLRQLWRTRDAHAQAMLGRYVSEISAKMTAAAVGPDPRMLVWEWLTAMKYRRALRHKRADTVLEEEAAIAEFATLLLGEELGLLQPASRWRVWLDGDTLRLATRLAPDLHAQLAEDVAQCTPEKLRLALKSVYQREFQLAPIDEPPFRQIGPDGRLANLGPNWPDDPGSLLPAEAVWP